MSEWLRIAKIELRVPGCCLVLTMLLAILVSQGCGAGQLNAPSNTTASNTPELSITTANLPDGTVGASYSAALAVTGGSPPYTWSLAAGQLPGGLALSSSGTITGSPTAAGSYSFTVQAADADGLKASRSLSTSVASSSSQLGVSPSSLSFGSVTVGTSHQQAVTLDNTGGNSVTVSQATITGGGFSLNSPSLPLTLASGQSATLIVVFAPAAAGSTTGTVAIVSTATNSPATIALSGTGATSLLSVKPTSGEFGTVVISESSTLPIVLSNTGAASITVSGVTISGTGFTVSGISVPLTLAAGENATVSVTFAPTTAGNFNGSVSVASNASNSPATEPLSGTGAHAAVLSWTASTSVVAGYNVYRGFISGGPYSQVNSAPIAATTYTDATVKSGQTYYYVTTAVASDGKESGYSNQVQATVPPDGA